MTVMQIITPAMRAQIDHPDVGFKYPKGIANPPLRQRLLSHTRRSHLDACWEWTGKLVKGYGVINIDGRSVRVPRLVFYLEHGYWPNIARHTCDWGACSNVNHILDGTNQDNVDDMNRRGRNPRKLKTRCPADHSYSDANTYVDKAGRRHCRICRHHPELRRPK